MSKSELTVSLNQPPARLLLGKSGVTSGCRSPHCQPPVISSVKDGSTHSLVTLGGVARTALTVTPTSRGGVAGQVAEVLSVMQGILKSQASGMVLTSQTIFLARESDRRECGRLFRESFGAALPVTHYVIQPPCSGAALAVEAWAIGGAGVAIEHHTSRSLSVSYDGMRWVHCGGVEAGAGTRESYAQTREVFDELGRELRAAGADWDEVVRTWFYLGEITGQQQERQRYRELNRARTDAFSGVHFGAKLMRGRNGHILYPASTGIGTLGRGLTGGCLALQTARSDVQLVPLENPGQVPAYRYHRKYSAQSPKFSRAMVVLPGDYATTWISGTASILQSESLFAGDIERQTHQTLDNIERLIAPENFALHGVPRAGATLHDLAKVRVYVKRPEDYARCRAVCEQRLGNLPTIYAIADVCRPELLVEIEGVAFSPVFSSGSAEVEEGR